ncbi:MAG: HlyD family type I secretion periplasmic adaptor subunit [Alphaproteobacteria bacterium]|nr:HlyD family type I secretion periplasmic adaptor subunit [Alphaproteobacteria bacterium]
MTGHPAARDYAAGRALLLGFAGTAVLLGGLLGWSLLASVSGAVIATGRVAAETRNQAVEHIDGGTVSEVLVRDGDRVAKGDLLLRFDDALLRSEEALLAARHAELAARRNRLEAEFRGADTIAWDRELAAMAAARASVRDILDGQERLFRARAAARTGEAAQLRERIGQARDEIAGLEAQAVSLREQDSLIGREVAAQRALFEKGLTQLPRLLALERAAKNLEGQAGATLARIARAKGGIAELEVRILQIDALRIQEAEEQARDASARENEVRERLASVRGRLGRMELRAPVAGEVFGMTVFAPGEVVGPGETILHIVPADARLVVRARIEPIDVDQVRPGQPALLRFSAFPARETPEFDGHVVRVSADAVTDDRNGLSWYEAELALGGPGADGAEREGRDRDGAAAGADADHPFGGLAVTPGMPVEVHIRTAERTVIGYLVKPVSDFFHRSLREE